MADDLRARVLRSDSPPRSIRMERPQRAPESDPLAELARLIGQDDVFDSMRRDAARAGIREARPDVAAAPLGGSSVDWRGTFEPNLRDTEHGADTVSARTAEPMLEPAAYSPAPAPLAYDRGPEDADVAEAHAPAAAYADEPYYADGPMERTAPVESPEIGEYVPEEYHDAPEALPPQRRRTGLVIGALLGVVAVGGAGAVGYRAMSGHPAAGQPPVIKAESGPAKIVPPPQPNSDQGGAKLGFDRNDKGQPEKVVVREEQPLEMREPRPSAPKMMVSGAPGVAGALPLTSAAGQAGAAPNSNEPKKVRTLAIRPDGSIAGPTPPKPQVATGATRGIGAPVAGAPAPVRTGDSTRAAPASPAPTQTASIRPASPPAGSGSHFVQVVSQKTEAEAQASIRDLQSRFSAVLAGRQPTVRKVELGARGTYYRAQVGPFASAEQANEFCGSLKAAGGQCIVQRN